MIRDCPPLFWGRSYSTIMCEDDREFIMADTMEIGIDKMDNIDALPLRASVKNSIAEYFSHLDGQGITGLYDMVLNEVEEPLLQIVMQITAGNQTHAAQCLGMSRGTLRKKLEQYGLL